MKKQTQVQRNPFLVNEGDKFLAIFFINDSPEGTDVIRVNGIGTEDKTWKIAERELAGMDVACNRVDLYRIPVSMHNLETSEISVVDCGDCIGSAKR